MLIDQPFPFTGVCVSSADVFGLKMLQLTVDVVSVRHRCWVTKILSRSGGYKKKEKTDKTHFNG